MFFYQDCMNQPAINKLKEHQSLYHRVVPFNESTDKLLQLDLSAGNSQLTEEIFNDLSTFSHYVTDLLKAANARYGIGGYSEHRKLYSSSPVFDEPAGDEPRRFHLGVDIWAKPYTPVMAPLDAIVHSVAFNNRQGDYGTTIILTHRLQDISFYTLYGHLSLNSIKNMSEGRRIEKGEIFAEFGISVENGHWPPHLHFQVILDVGQYKGDYPGVCKYSERDYWLANSPDPDIILQLNQFL